MSRANIRRTVVLLSGITFVSIPAIAACQPDSHPDRTVERRRDSVRLRVWGFTEDVEHRGVHAAAREFEKRHPGIEIAFGTPGGRGGMDPQKLMTAIAGGSPPEVMLQDRFAVGGWAARGAFTPLDDLIERDRLDMDDFYPACRKEATYRGKVYAIPYTTDCRALYYNRRLFREAGLDPDRPPGTWDGLLEYAVRLTRKDPQGRLKTIGFIPNYGNSWLYFYGWQNGGKFMSDDGKTCTLDDPRIVEALEWMTHAYDTMGGRREVVSGFESSFTSGLGGSPADPFFIGQVAMKIDGDWVLKLIARYKADLDFGVAPAPVPEGRPFITWSGGFSFVIPVGAGHREEAWEYIKWMTSLDAARVHAAAVKRFNAQRGVPLYVPAMNARRSVTSTIFQEFAPDIPKFQKALRTFMDLMEVSKFRPVTPVGQELWDEHVRAFELATYHIMSPKEALQVSTRKVQRALDELLAKEAARAGEPVYAGKGAFPVVELIGAIAGIVALALSTSVVILLLRARKRYRMRQAEWAAGYLFAAPWIVGFVILFVGPMIVSAVFSFMEYDVLHKPEFVGLANYKTLVGVHAQPGGGLAPSDPLFWKSLWNTLFIVVFGVPLSMVVGLSIALLLNAELRGIAAHRTGFYAPAVMPVVAMAILWRLFLNPESGLFAAVVEQLNRPVPSLVAGFIVAALVGTALTLSAARYSERGRSFVFRVSVGIGVGLCAAIFLRHLEPINWFGDQRWTKPGLILILLWSSGATMILWLAGLKGIPTVLYEAAEIDGATTWQKFRSVTLPMLTPYIFFNLVMGVIAYFQIFTQAYVLVGNNFYAAGPADSLLFYVFYLFNNAFQYFKMGYASAMAWLLFLVILTLTAIQLRLARRWVYYEGMQR
jgi:ABC-type sugar transport system permease subunit/ABC-type glycerol-3-phosphate transport system substrate-binding protein